MKIATVIIPSIGNKELLYSIESVIDQTYDNTICYVVIDGIHYMNSVIDIIDSVNNNKIKKYPKIKTLILPENVGSNGFYGHRVYAGVTHLINTDYVFYLDADNFLENDHVESCINTIEQQNLDWCYSLRKIVDKHGNFICNDDCESLGKWSAWTNTNHIDTSCYCVKKDIAVKVASVWHGGWGQDRVYGNTLMTHFKNFNCTKKYTVNYRLDGNEGSVKKDFFIKGNSVMSSHYNDKFPWNN